MYKKSQIKFGETIGILFIVYLMVVGGLIWYNSVNSKSLNKLYKEDQLDRAFEKYYYISSLSMLRKSNRGVIDNVYDLDSLRVFANYSKTQEGREFLRSQLSDSKITVFLYKRDEISSNNPYENVTLYEDKINETHYEITSEIRFKTLIPVVNRSDSVNVAVLEVISYVK